MLTEVECFRSKALWKQKRYRRYSAKENKVVRGCQSASQWDDLLFEAKFEPYLE